MYRIYESLYGHLHEDIYDNIYEDLYEYIYKAQALFGCSIGDGDSPGVKTVYRS